MNKALRKAVIAGNWKMNKTPSEAKALLTEIAPLVKDAEAEVIFCCFSERDMEVYQAIV